MFKNKGILLHLCHIVTSYCIFGEVGEKILETQVFTVMLDSCVTKQVACSLARCYFKFEA